MESFLSPRELARKSGWPEKRIRDLIAERQLRHVWVRSRILIPEDALCEFVKRHMIVPEERAGSEVGDKQKAR